MAKIISLGVWLSLGALVGVTWGNWLHPAAAVSEKPITQTTVVPKAEAPCSTHTWVLWLFEFSSPVPKNGETGKGHWVGAWSQHETKKECEFTKATRDVDTSRLTFGCFTDNFDPRR